MSHIYDLFDHIMESIFKNLSRHDRLKCKEVCQRWYNYLMDLPAFRDDRHIYLPDDCRVEYPLLIFSATNRSYEKLTVKHVKEADDFGPLARVLGNNGLKNVHFSSTKTKTVHQMLLRLPFIKCLTVDLHRFDPEFYKIPSNRIFFGCLRDVKLYTSNHLLTFFDKDVSALRKLIPKEATINVVFWFFNLFEWTSLIEEMISASNVNFEMKQVEVSSYCSSKNIAKFTKCNYIFDELQIEYLHKMAESLKNEVKILIDKMKNLKKISVSTEKLSNLQSLTQESINKISKLFIHGYPSCTGEHETFHLPSLVEMTVGKIDCQECLNAIFNSFLPKLKFLQIIDPPFLRNWKNLESLKILIPTFNTAGIFQDALPSLRSLTIAPFRTQFFQVSVKTIEDIGKLCPQLEIFKIYMLRLHVEEIRINPSMGHLKDILTTEFENLKTFDVLVRDYEMHFLKKSGVLEMKREQRNY